MMEYFYGAQSAQFASVEIPKELLTGKVFSSLSPGAKLMYAVLLDRMREAKRHSWYDEQNRVYSLSTEEIGRRHRLFQAHSN